MRYFLSLGANLGEREETLRRALQLLDEQAGKVVRQSSFYYSEPWGFVSAHPFCNLCCVLDSALQPIELLDVTQSIERALGREHKSKNALYNDRTIDIDLLFAYDAEGKEVEWSDERLTLPHPRWQERDFVREPLKEVEN